MFWKCLKFLGVQKWRKTMGFRLSNSDKDTNYTTWQHYRFRCHVLCIEKVVAFFGGDGRSGRMDERNHRLSKKGLGWHCLVWYSQKRGPRWFCVCDLFGMVSSRDPNSKVGRVTSNERGSKGHFEAPEVFLKIHPVLHMGKCILKSYIYICDFQQIGVINHEPWMNFQPCPGKPFVKHCITIIQSKWHDGHWLWLKATWQVDGKGKSERPLPVELGQLTLVAEPEGSLKVSEKPGSVT